LYGCKKCRKISLSPQEGGPLQASPYKKFKGAK
jgi:hypothetical protein